MHRISVCATFITLLLAADTQAREPARDERPPLLPRIHTEEYLDVHRDVAPGGPARTQAVADTFVLGHYTFDGPSGPDPQGWTGVDYAQGAVTDTFFHVADATELTGGSSGYLTVLQGSQSLWCGAAPADSGSLCSYATLPGYGNNWRQYFTSIKFARAGDVTLSFLTLYDSEPGEDFTYVEFLDADGYWEELDDYDRISAGPVVQRMSYVIPGASLGDSIQVRFYFRSDGAWSDEDGLWPTDGAIVIDSLALGDEGGSIDYQDFETEPPGMHRTMDGHWHASTIPTFGNFTGLFSGAAVLQEDGCIDDLSALWGFFNGSTDDYSCGGHPEQPTVPSGVTGSYDINDFLLNEIWSPVIDWTHDMNGTPIPSSAEHALLEFDVYRDLSLESLVFYRWNVRSFDGDCTQDWVSDRFVYYGNRKDWFHHRVQIGGAVDPGTDRIQVSLSAVDMCPIWCGFLGDGSCHSHAPLFDNIRITRIDIAGPAWDTLGNRYTYLFQDNFAADGTLTGTVPIDGPRNVTSGATQDEARVYVTSPAGIDRHMPGDILTGPAVYCHVKDVSPEKSGSVISGDPAKYHWIATADDWTVLQCYGTDQGQTGPNFNIDLNDELYQPGDTLWYYFSARDVNGVTTYWSASIGATSSEAEARTKAMEVTCLPANALDGTTGILYVDGFEGYGAQPYFENAFDMLGVTPDRFDVVDPSFNVLSGPGARVMNVDTQIASVYRTIIWNTGYFRSAGIHDGVAMSPSQPTSDDFGLLYAFLDQSQNRPGVYLSGDNLASWWLTRTGSGAVDMRTNYMNFNVLGGSHTSLGEAVSPIVVGMPGSCFDRGSEGLDVLIAYGGGCSGVNDFDVLEPAGTAQKAMVYLGDDAHAAVLTQFTPNSAGDIARVVLEGFSFHTIRDYEPGSPPARALHLEAILRWLENEVDYPTGVFDRMPMHTALMQNYPNPFNPSTTIRYSIAAQGRVTLKIYGVTGALVRVLADEVQTPRAEGYEAAWDGRNDDGASVASGVYFYRLKAGGEVLTRKALLLK
jgi:hypothetical protein